MAGGGGDGTRTLEQTSTWAVAGVCAVIIAVSIALEKVLHRLGTWLTKRQNKALCEALEKIKAELMILGFISLILVFCQYYIASICIPVHIADTMLPCHPEGEEEAHEYNYRRLLLYKRRVLAGDVAPSCKEGRVALISADGLHQIHILIFFLAFFHVIYSVITMTLGRFKIRSWKRWEQEISSHNYELPNDALRTRLSHETSFVRAHTGCCTRLPLFFYIACFFQQFLRSVSKSDYLTLRHGFISAHLAPGSKFNFQKYIKRSLEDDFKTVVGVSPVLWASFVVFLLLNVKGWQTPFWTSLIPVVLILAVGTKLQAILSNMAIETTERHAVVQGIPLVQGSNKFFWFNRPQFVLHLIHFALFQNAFQITYFLWIWYEFGVKSCFHGTFWLAIAKVGLGVGVLFLCSYITLPLYALVAQMGSHMKKSIFDEQTSQALKKWHQAAKKKKQGEGGGRPPTRTLGSGKNLTSSAGLPLHPAGSKIQRFNTTGHTTRSSARYDDLDDDASDLEDPSTPPSPTGSSTTPTQAVDRYHPHVDEIKEVGLAPSNRVSRNEDDKPLTNLV